MHSVHWWLAGFLTGLEPVPGMSVTAEFGPASLHVRATDKTLTESRAQASHEVSYIECSSMHAPASDGRYHGERIRGELREETRNA